MDQRAGQIDGHKNKKTNIKYRVLLFYISLICASQLSFGNDPYNLVDVIDDVSSVFNIFFNINNIH